MVTGKQKHAEITSREEEYLGVVQCNKPSHSHDSVSHWLLVTEDPNQVANETNVKQKEKENEDDWVDEEGNQ